MADANRNGVSSAGISVVILGDLHGHWDDEDERYYAALPCDLLLWTGDLANSPRRQYAVAESLAPAVPKPLACSATTTGRRTSWRPVKLMATAAGSGVCPSAMLPGFGAFEQYWASMTSGWPGVSSRTWA